MSRGRPGKIHTKPLAGAGGLPDRGDIDRAIASALSGWLDPEDDEEIEMLERIQDLIANDIQKAFASYQADSVAAAERVSASDEQKDLDAIHKDAVYLLDHDDGHRRIRLMHRMQMFPPFAYAVLVEKHGMAFMGAADRLRECVEPEDLKFIADALADPAAIPVFTKRINVARNRLAARLEELYKDNVHELRVEIWQRYIYGNEPVPPCAHAQFAEDVMRSMGVKFETKSPR